MTPPLAPKHLQVGTRWRYSSGALHASYDYPVPSGTPVFAVRDGVVLDCADGVANNRPGVNPGSGSPSNWILLGVTYKGRPASVFYQHLSPGLDVRKGQRVAMGQKLGESGNTGNSTGPHLHLATMWGHRDGASRFSYLSGIGTSEGAPKGTASNGVCIYPPTMVFPRRRGPSPWSKGDVFLDKLRFGETDSDSVRRLQHRLNRVPLEGGVELPVTGNYLELTRNEVTKWQLQKARAKPGTPEAEGVLTAGQAHRLFGGRYRLRS